MSVEDVLIQCLYPMTNDDTILNEQVQSIQYVILVCIWVSIRIYEESLVTL